MAKTVEFNRRFVAAFMALMLTISFLAGGFCFSTKADDPVSPPNPADYLEVNKTLSANENGTYDINLEAYAKGEISDIAITEKIPTDFVIIVDQSGSMATTDMPASKDSYTKVTGSTYPDLETVAEGRYYYLDEATGQYYRVYGKRGYLYYKYAANTKYANDFYGTSLFYYFSDETTTASGANGYYYYDAEDAAWYPISMAVEGHLIGEQSGMLYECRFSYDRNGTQVALPYSSSRSYHAYRQLLWTRIDAGSDKIVYDFYRRYLGYNGLFYRDINGVEHAVQTVTGETTTNYCTSDGANAVTTVNGSQQMRYDNLYTLKSGSANVKTRLEALTHALNEFSAAVAAETDTFGAVDNKVAIVGFSSQGYKNTEILTGSEIGYGNSGASFLEGSYYFPYKGQNYANATTGNSGATNYTGPQYYTESGTGIVEINDTHYKNALIAANNGTAGTVNPDLTKAIKSIGAYGGTHPEDGFDMAANIIEQRTMKKYTIRSGEHKDETVNRNVIVIYFTDGRPSDYQYSNQYDGANAVVHNAEAVKKLGASVFSIGVFGESDGNPLTYGIKHYARGQEDAATQDAIYDVDYVDQYYAGTENTKHDDDWVNHTYYNYYYLYRMWMPGQATAYGDTANDTIFDYMSVTSSNHPGASYFIDPEWNSSTETWKHMTERVRGTAPQINSYYRMASNQDTLVEAFKAAVTMNNTETDTSTTTINDSAILRDIISDKFNASIETDEDQNVISGVSVQAFPCLNVENGTPVFSDVGESVENLIIKYDSAIKTLDVSGFDYGSNYSAESSPSHADVLGKKLVVTIEGVTPTSSAIGANIYSNDDSSGIYTESSTDSPVKPFPLPAIARYQYKLNAADCSDTSFDVNYTLQKEEGSPASEAVVIRDGTSAKRYDQLTNNKFISNESHGSNVYVEYITNHGKSQTANPADYSLSATVSPTDTSDQYTYYLGTVGYPEQIDSNQLPGRNPVELSSTPSSENAFYINRKDNNRIVTIHLNAEESPYVDNSYEFKVNVSWVKDDQNGSETLTLPYKNGQITPRTVSVPFGATVTISHSDYFYDTKISETAGQGSAEDYSITNVTANKDTYITDTAKSNIGEGVLEDQNPTRIVLYGLAGVCALSAGAGAAYVYRKKDKFVE